MARMDANYWNGLGHDDRETGEIREMAFVSKVRSDTGTGIKLGVTPALE
jgi:hypothetical protein